MGFSVVVKSDVTYVALFAVQSPAWGIHFFALLVFALLLQVIAVGIITMSSGDTSHETKAWYKHTFQDLQQLATRFIVVSTHWIKVEDRLPPEIHHLDEQKERKCWANRSSNTNSEKQMRSWYSPRGTSAHPGGLEPTGCLWRRCPSSWSSGARRSSHCCTAWGRRMCWACWRTEALGRHCAPPAGSCKSWWPEMLRKKWKCSC